MAPPSNAPPPGANGVLPVPAAALQKNTTPAAANGAPRAATNRSHQPRLKLVVRRLAPALTQQEFELAMGDEWKLGQGKVDWFAYKAGKISKDLAKPSKPSRAYLRLTDQAHVVPLADKVRKTAFNDAKNSTRDPVLIGPPTVEFAPFSRTPGGRRRNDARQGLIDQDPEFKDFLESLTNPPPKPAPVDNVVDDATVKKEEVKTTPLIEHLREKKAAKEKPQPAKGKHARGESKDEKATSKSDKKSRKSAKEEKSSKQSKSEKAAKESTPKEVKILNKGSANKNTDAEKTDENKPAAPSAPASERKRERGSTSIAKQMLQRDLGIGPAAGSRRGRRDTAQEPAKAAECATPKEAASSPASPSPATNNATPPSNPSKAGSEPRSGKKDSRPTRAERRAQKAAKANAEAAATDQAKPTAAPMPPTGPKILKKPQNAQQQATPAATTPINDGSANVPPPKAPTGPAAQQNSPATSRPNSSRKANNNNSASTAPTAAALTASTARQAFLKHANPSQGITEPLIEAALSVFGVVDKVEIDKRKGFAYVDFKEPEGLQKAIQASPVKVAEGAVQVLERKDKPPAQRASRVQPPAGPAAAGGPMVGGGGAGGAGGGRAGFRGGRGGRGRGGGGGGGGGGANASTANAAAPAAAAPKAQAAAAADTPS